MGEQTVQWRELSPEGSLETCSWIIDSNTPIRTGIVSTVYKAGETLLPWCRHHFSLGFNHLVLVFDHLDQPEEAKTAEQIRHEYPPDLVTLWSGRELLEADWGAVSELIELVNLVPMARSGSGSQAVSARQCLNASMALQAARGDQLGGSPLDWLLHIDQDELFFLSDGGPGDIRAFFNALRNSGVRLVRFTNHERLLPDTEGLPIRFKINPNLAAALLGTDTWEGLLSQLPGGKPYFHGYTNGKSAVAVRYGSCAAGVHSWWLSDITDHTQTLTLAEPAILHLGNPSPFHFSRKYLTIGDSSAPEGGLLFDPPQTELIARELIQKARGENLSLTDIERRLIALHTQLTYLPPRVIQKLDKADLIFTPNFKFEFPHSS